MADTQHRLRAEIVIYRETLIQCDMDPCELAQWSPDRLAHECRDFRGIPALRAKLFPNDDAQEFRQFVQFCRDNFQQAPPRALPSAAASNTNANGPSEG